ncbi:hypothetical protein FGB62_203g037 [Gracilaria domingensis]|nr:hypothetical protein FGB62_203g037 [Gracilaria domingensis]
MPHLTAIKRNNPANGNETNSQEKKARTGPAAQSSSGRAGNSPAVVMANSSLRSEARIPAPVSRFLADESDEDIPIVQLSSIARGRDSTILGRSQQRSSRVLGQPSETTNAVGDTLYHNESSDLPRTYIERRAPQGRLRFSPSAAIRPGQAQSSAVQGGIVRNTETGASAAPNIEGSVPDRGKTSMKRNISSVNTLELQCQQSELVSSVKHLKGHVIERLDHMSGRLDVICEESKNTAREKAEWRDRDLFEVRRMGDG